MSAIAAKTIVAQEKCSCCGKPVEVKLNKNGNAYYFCPWSDDYGQPCSHHERWGKGRSRKFAEAYLNGQKVAGSVAPVKYRNVTAGPAANDQTPPKPQKPTQTPEKRRSGTFEDYM